MSGAKSSTNPTQKILIVFHPGINTLAPMSKAQRINYFSQNPNQAFLAVCAIMRVAHYIDT